MLRPLAAAAVLGAAAGAALWGARSLLPREGEVALGVRVGGAPVAPGQTAPAAVAEAAGRLLARRVALTYEGQTVIEASLEELGATVDTAVAARAIAGVGHEAGIFARIDAALEARRGHVDVPLHVAIPVEPLAARLERVKDERDAPPLPARLDLVTRTATPHVPGRYLDVYAAAAAIDRAVEAGTAQAELAAFTIAPRASTDAVTAIDTSHVVSRFETRFGEGGKQSGRAGNVRRAARGMEGVVIMPGETVSFNANVGARSLDNGFALAPEIFKGELRDGIGGGTCQVSGTLHAAAYFGGLDVVERSNHSRPSGYIKVGLDATVVFPTVDLKLKNPYDFPIVIHSTAEKGTLTFELRGREAPAKVDMETTTIGTADYKRRVEEDPALLEGAVVLKQKGIRGVSVRKTRTIHLAGGIERVEVGTDTYPPTFEIYHVGPGTDLESLPPLPQKDDDRTASAAAPAAPLAGAAPVAGTN